MSAIPDHILHRGVVNKAADKAADAVLEAMLNLQTIHLNANKPSLLTSDNQDRANYIYEAMSSDGMIPFTTDDAQWLLNYEAATRREQCKK